MTKTKKYNPVQAAIEKSGMTQLQFSKKCKVSQPTISKWLKKGVIPPRRVLLVEKISGIERSKLNPSIFNPHCFDVE